MKITFLTRFSRAKEITVPKFEQMQKAGFWFYLCCRQVEYPYCTHIQRCTRMQTQLHTLTAELPLLAWATPWTAGLSAPRSTPITGRGLLPCFPEQNGHSWYHGTSQYWVKRTSMPLFCSPWAVPEEKRFAAYWILTNQNSLGYPPCFLTRHFRHFFMGLGNHVSLVINRIEPQKIRAQFQTPNWGGHSGLHPQKAQTPFPQQSKTYSGRKRGGKSQAQQFLIFFLLTFLN